ncbi:hypothetical protein [Streptomyces rhizosphaericus]|uniref:hypothetical protein n=1 Tax=Streptomyces rhizosphaericus TaxID=114699 RepID=UPI0028932D2F|nr:hypothetical protein [Streptomyces rhizosphaericus]
MAVVGHHWAQQGDSVDPAGAFDPGRGGVGGIDDVFGRGQAGVGEVVVDLR